MRKTGMMLCWAFVLAFLFGAPAFSRTTNHSAPEALEGPFKTGPDVTRACLSSHNTAGHQIMKSVHWTWEKTSPTSSPTLMSHIRSMITGYDDH